MTEPIARTELDPNPDSNPDTNVAIVEKFLFALRDRDFDLATSLLDDDVLYQNAGLTTMRGNRRVIKALKGVGLDVKFHHNVAADDVTVINERTDLLIAGPVRIAIWVWGKFEVHNGRITLWRDYIDTFDFIKGILRGLVGVVIPPLNRKF
jgi:limonene-1,2-epoxide hydrolase